MSDAMLYVEGKRFTCECKCNVFRVLDKGETVSLYACNGCGAKYEGGVKP